jgi:hypothetical protein
MKKLYSLLFIMLFSVMAFSQVNISTKNYIRAYAKDKWGSDCDKVNLEYEIQLNAATNFYGIYNQFGCDKNSETKDVSYECLVCIMAYAKYSDEGTGFVQWDKVMLEMFSQLDAFQEILIDTYPKIKQ